MKLTSRQKKIARAAPPFGRITGADFRKIVKDAHERYDPDKGSKKERKKLRIKVKKEEKK